MMIDIGDVPTTTLPIYRTPVTRPTGLPLARHEARTLGAAGVAAWTVVGTGALGLGMILGATVPAVPLLRPAPIVTVAPATTPPVHTERATVATRHHSKRDN